MRFLLYNVRYCAGIGKGFHFPLPYGGYLKRSTDNLQDIAAFIKSYKPDIVGLVEVDSGSYRSKKQNQAEIIAKSMGHYHTYRSKYGVKSMMRRIPLVNMQGNAFLASGKIKKEQFHYFKKGIKRLVIELELEDVTIFLVHLSIRFRRRHEQLGDLVNLVRKTKKPVIVAGDFNPLRRGGDELTAFMNAAGLVSADKKNRPTHPSWNPKRHLDFVLHSPEIKITHFVTPHVQFSDHLPIVCDFEVSKPPAG